MKSNPISGPKAILFNLLTLGVTAASITCIAYEQAQAAATAPRAPATAPAAAPTTSRDGLTYNGTPGSPSASVSPDGKALPAPVPPFGGVIKEKATDSTPWWPPRVAPPKGAPNVLLIMTDDCGFGAPGTFGGVVPTPALERIAQNGLRYTQFHSCALCSPTRAALITGRNHHVAGYGVVGEAATGYPGYDSVIQKDCGTIAATLKGHGYATSWFGKDHNTPFYQSSQAGPFDQWPVGMGFDYFYGFVGGDTSQWQPNLFRNTTAIYPFQGNPGWNLTTAMADDAIGYMKQLKEIAPEQPFFVYYVPGGTHSPHHPTSEWIKKVGDMHLFDAGWNKLRETIFANQKRLGILPANAQLTAWPKELPEWDSLDWESKKLFIKQADVYGAYLAYTDYEIGRVIQAVDDMGKLDNTLVIYISGDNGASAEGMLNGTPNEFTTFNGVPVPVKDQFLWYEFWGSDRTFPHFAAPWAWAMDTPFKWVKQVASHRGGTAQGVCMSWPGHITDKGGIRDQFHHVIDIVPTILEATGITAPETINGVQQRPIEGISMAYTWDKAGAALPTRHTTQYFEMLGNRAIYHDGWMATTSPVTLPWDLNTKPPPDVITGYKWELYNLKEDVTEANDLAEKMPEKVKELQAVFDAEAKKYNVFPLDNSTLSRFLTPRPSATAGKTLFEYSGGITGVPAACAPNILCKDYIIEAQLDIPSGGAQGVVVTEGGRFGGYALLLSSSYNYWLESRFFSSFGIAFILIGLLLVALAKNRNWSRRKTRWSYGVLSLGMLWIVAVAATGMFELGKGKPVFIYNLLDLQRTIWEGPSLSAGKHTIRFTFKYAGPGFGKGGTGELFVDGKSIEKKTMEHTVPVMFPEDEDFDVGQDTRTGVALLEHRYDCPFKFTGTIDKLTFDLGPAQYTELDRKELPGIAERVARARD